MKKQLLILFCLLSLASINAQEKITKVKSQFKINVLLPGFVYEHGLSTKNTLYSELSSGYGYTSNGFGKTFTFYPIINEQFRHYYNLEKRAKKEKVTAHNSGGFVAVIALYNFRSISTNDNFRPANSSITISPVWGFQRTYKGNFNLDLNMGIGYNLENNNSEIVPVLNFALGWVIGK
jgi:hypothetical protein